jgi:hypothetical protein
LQEMQAHSPEWNALIKYWQELEDCLMAEVGEWFTDEYSTKTAPLTMAMMLRIYTTNAEIVCKQWKKYPEFMCPVVNNYSCPSAGPCAIVHR